jgi:signal transduction histidine kinase
MKKFPELFSLLAHDVTNPMHAVFSLLYTVLEHQEDDVRIPEKTRILITQARRAASRALGIVRNYSILAELTGNTCSSRMSGKTDIIHLINEVIENSYRNDQDNISLKTFFPPNPVYVRGSEALIDPIVTNLFSNCLKYTPPSGSITVSVIPNEKTEVAILFWNNGEPIPKEDISLIFNYFTRSSTSLGIPGSGLGLYIVKRIINLLGGSIEVSSGKLEGTMFTVRLPQDKS